MQKTSETPVRAREGMARHPEKKWDKRVGEHIKVFWRPTVVDWHDGDNIIYTDQRVYQDPM
jgi:hypothetical protein